MDVDLEALLAEAPLAEHWTQPELFAEAANVAGCRIQLIGLSARRNDGAVALGSAAGLGDWPLRRAYFELLERASILDVTECDSGHMLLDESRQTIGWCSGDVAFPVAPRGASWRYARSNGIASRPDWLSACTAARLELAERDAVLRSWYGSVAPRAQPLPDGVVPAGLRALYEVEAAMLGPAASDLPGSVVAGVFLFPRETSMPIAYGFSARFTLSGALVDAARECLQSLGFLWGEVIPGTAPQARPDPGFHQDYYLHARHHDRLRRWLRGEHVGANCTVSAPRQAMPAYMDLTPRHLRGRISVAKALPGCELPLTFGVGHPNVVVMPQDLAVHPIT